MTQRNTALIETMYSHDMSEVRGWTLRAAEPGPSLIVFGPRLACRAAFRKLATTAPAPVRGSLRLVLLPDGETMPDRLDLRTARRSRHVEVLVIPPELAPSKDAIVAQVLAKCLELGLMPTDDAPHANDHGALQERIAA